MIIYSFDDVLRARKMIHSVELTPGGGHAVALWRPVPWMAVLYFAVVELVFLIAARYPVTDVVSQMFAPAVYYVAFPAGVVWLAFKVELDGRAPHLWLASYLLFLKRPKRTLAGRTVDPPDTRVAYAGRVRIWWDVTAPRLHHGWVLGGRVCTVVPARFTHSLWHRQQLLVGDDDRAPVVDHEVQGRLQVRP